MDIYSEQLKIKRSRLSLIKYQQEINVKFSANNILCLDIPNSHSIKIRAIYIAISMGHLTYITCYTAVTGVTCSISRIFDRRKRVFKMYSICCVVVKLIPYHLCSI